MTHSWVAVLVALAVLLAPAASAAQDTPPSDEAAVAEAREHFRVAMTHYEAGRFREAAAEFQRSYDLSHRPELLHNIYLSRRDMGDIRGAVDALRLYLTEATIPEADRTTLVHRLHGMESSLGQAPSPEPARPAPEPTAETDTHASEPTTTDGTTVEGTTEGTTEITTEPDARILASPASSSDVTQEGWFWALIATAGVLVVGGVVTGIVVATTPGAGIEGQVGGQITTLRF